jgi:Family of unknown function (DUF5691)
MNPVTSADLDQLRQALTLGLSRQPLKPSAALAALMAEAPGERALAMLALAGQRLRFERTASPEMTATPEAAIRLHEDPRPVMPEPLRRALLRLVRGADKSMTGAVASAAVRRLGASGYRLNPFDLPGLMPHIKVQADQLGLAERAYLALTEVSDVPADAPSLLYTDITRDNWTAFPKGARGSFLRAERRRDAGQARALLEAVFKMEPAATRGDLLTALDVGLSRDDLPFLESIATDRAESVRTIVASLVSCVPGTAAFEGRIAAVAACFSRASGLGKVASSLGLGNEVNYAAPKGTNHVQINALFAGLTAHDIAAAAKITVAELLDALPANDYQIFPQFLAAASAASDPASAVLQLVMHKLEPTRSDVYPHVYTLQQLTAELTTTLPDDFACELLASERWRGVIKRYTDATASHALKDDGTLIITATLLPTAAMSAFLATLEPLLVTTTRSARDFALT